MKKAAYTILFLIIVFIFLFYFMFNRRTDINKKPLDGLTEPEEYCFVKKGKIEEREGEKFCVVDGVSYQVDKFFVTELKKGLTPTEISLE